MTATMTAPKKKPARKMRFRLLVGTHHGYLPENFAAMSDEQLAAEAETRNLVENGKITARDAANREKLLTALRKDNSGLYREDGSGHGNIIESDVDLCATWNRRGKAPKFERLEERQQGEVWDKTVETLAEFTARMEAMEDASADNSDDITDAEGGQGEAPPSDLVAADLEAMSNLNLRELAKARSVDLQGVNSKKDIIARLMGEEDVPE